MAKQILVIDDDMTVSGLLHAHLTAEGFDVSVTSMAEEGFTLATTHPPALIMLDVQLPDATGFQMVGRFRSNPITKEIPIILMSGAARWSTQQAVGKSMGANDYVLKPFDIEIVAGKIRLLIGEAPKVEKTAEAAQPPVSLDPKPLQQETVFSSVLPVFPESPEAAPLQTPIIPFPDILTPPAQASDVQPILVESPVATISWEALLSNPPTEKAPEIDSTKPPDDSPTKPVDTPPSFLPEDLPGTEPLAQTDFPSVPLHEPEINPLPEPDVPKPFLPPDTPVAAPSPIAETPSEENPWHDYSEEPVVIPPDIRSFPLKNPDPPMAQAPAIAAASDVPVLHEELTERGKELPASGVSRRQILYGLFAGALIVALWFFLHVSKPSVRAVIQEAVYTPANTHLILKGRVSPGKTDTIVAPFGGSVANKRFKQGQHVAQDEVLLDLGRSQIRGDHEVARRRLLAARGQLESARKALLDTQSLPSDLISADGLIKDKRRLAHAEEAVAAAQADFSREDARWKSNRIRAPYAGVIIEDSIAHRPSVSAGNPIAVISSGKEKLFRATLDGADGTRVHVGQSAQVQLNGSTNAAEATVIEIHSSLEGDTIVTSAVLRFLNPQQLKSDVDGNATAEVSSADGAPTISVPSTALIEQQGHTYLWIVTSLHKLLLREVTPGDRIGDQVVISHGLSAGDRYCAVADSGFRPGLYVKSAAPAATGHVPS